MTIYAIACPAHRSCTPLVADDDSGSRWAGCGVTAEWVAHHAAHGALEVRMLEAFKGWTLLEGWKAMREEMNGG